MSHRIRVPLVIALACGALGVSPAAASPPDETFRGHCELTLTVVHDPPLTTSLAAGTAEARGSGSCTGELTRADGRTVFLDGARVNVRASSTGELSCGGGLADGSGVMSFAAARIGFGMREVRGPGTATLYYTGTSGGSGLGEASLSPDRDPAGPVDACTGDGLRDVRVVEQVVSKDMSG